MNYYLSAFKKYAVFSGRATRSEYWYFALFNFLISMAISLLPLMMGEKNVATSSLVSSIISFAYSLAVLLPGLGLLVRRLHDIGKSGWMMFVFLIPLAGPIWMLIMLATDSNPGDNKYGSNPKAAAVK